MRSRDAGFARAPAHLLLELAAADMDETPFERGRQLRQRVDQHVIALLGHEPADRQQDDRIGGVAAVAHRPRGGGLGKAREIEAVIDERDALRVGRQRAQMLGAGLRAGDEPGRSRSFSRFSHVGNRPDVLGVGRAAPRQAGHHRGIARDRGRRVQEMRVEMADAGRQLMAPARRPGRSGGRDWASDRAASRAATGAAPRDSRAGGAPRASRATRAAARARHIPADTGPGASISRCTGWVARSVGWRSETMCELQAALLEAAQFLGDEGLRETRIALEDDGDGWRRDGRRQTGHRWGARYGRANATLARSGSVSQRSASRLRLPRPSSRPGTTTSRRQALLRQMAQRRGHGVGVALAVVDQHREQAEILGAASRA